MKYWALKYFDDEDTFTIANCSTKEKAEKAKQLVLDDCDWEDWRLEIYEEDLELDEYWTRDEQGNDVCINL